MTNAEKDAIVKFMEETIETESSCTTGEAFYKITTLTVGQSLHSDIDRIVARMLENNKYLKEGRSPEFGYDFTISKNPNYELNQNIIATNESLQAANLSTQGLNTETSRYYGKANRATWAIAFLTTIGAIIAGISAYTSHKALVQNHKQFEIETTPFLQMEILNCDISIGQLVSIIYSVKNLGKDQAKIDSCQIGIIMSNSIDTLIFLHQPSLMTFTRPNAYSIKENPYQASAVSSI